MIREEKSVQLILTTMKFSEYFLTRIVVSTGVHYIFPCDHLEFPHLRSMIESTSLPFKLDKTFHPQGLFEIELL